MRLKSRRDGAEDPEEQEERRKGGCPTKEETDGERNKERYIDET